MIPANGSKGGMLFNNILIYKNAIIEILLRTTVVVTIFINNYHEEKVFFMH